MVLSTHNKDYVKYIVKLLLLYFILDYGTTWFIGITSPGGKTYIQWLDKYLNYVRWLRYTILHGAEIVMQMLGYKTKLYGLYIIKVINGSSVQLVYSCLGYGVISFWIAFILANKSPLKFKIFWLLVGVFVIIFSNIVRVCVLLLAHMKHWYKPFAIDHHTFYNIIAYTIVITMMFVYLKQLRKIDTAEEANKASMPQQ